MTTQELAIAIIEHVTARTTLAWILQNPQTCTDHPRRTIAEATAQEVALTIGIISTQATRTLISSGSAILIARNANGDDFSVVSIIHALDEYKYSEKEIKKMCEYLAIATARAKCAIANIRGMQEFDDRARSLHIPLQ